MVSARVAVQLAAGPVDEAAAHVAHTIQSTTDVWAGDGGGETRLETKKSVPGLGGAVNKLRRHNAVDDDGRCGVDDGSKLMAPVPHGVPHRRWHGPAVGRLMSLIHRGRVKREAGGGGPHNRHQVQVCAASGD